jgi:hypothetical protein
VKELSVVLIPYEESSDFEEFLYAQLNYHEHGWTRYSHQEYHVYLLDLDSPQKTMIALRYQGSKVEPYRTSGFQP